MQVQEKVVEDVVVFGVSGNHTPGTAGTLQKGVDSALQRGYRKVVLDLEGVSDLGAGGLGELVSSYLAVRQLGGQLKLSGVPDRVEHFLEITRLASVFERWQSTQQAVGSLLSRLERGAA